MILGANSFLGALCGRRRLVFVDIGSNLNSEDFELFSAGPIDIGSVSYLTRQDFELYTDGLSVSLAIDPLARSYTLLENETDGTLYELAALFTAGLGNTAAAVGYTAYDNYALQTFEAMSVGLTSTLPTPDTAPSGLTQPTGAFFQVYA